MTRGANPVVVKGWNAWNYENGKYEWVPDSASMAKVLANKDESKCFKPLIAVIRPVRDRYVYRVIQPSSQVMQIATHIQTKQTFSSWQNINVDLVHLCTSFELSKTNSWLPFKFLVRNNFH